MPMLIIGLAVLLLAHLTPWLAASGNRGRRVPVTRRHLQLNIKQTMHPEAIQQDVERAFAFLPDTIVFNEAVAVTHAAIRAACARLGYGYWIPDGAAGQVVICWNRSSYRALYRKSVRAMKGRRHVSPTRVVNRVRLLDLDTSDHVTRIGTHMVSSGWTGTRWLDAWRQAGWHVHEMVMAAVLRWVYRRNDLIVWSGDLNRPPSTFPKGRILPRWQIPGAATSMVVHTDATHGRVTFDYMGFLSKLLKVTVEHVETPGFHSDHDGILVDVTA